LNPAAGGMKMDVMAPAPITHVFFDIGGVLGTNGWDRHERAKAVERFALDGEDFERRHEDAAGTFEAGKMTLDEYLEDTVFFEPRPFAPDAFKAFMREQSRPFPDSIQVARELKEAGRHILMTLNNESADLNVHRLRSFGLVPLFSAFFSSCWVGAVKPARRIYEVARDMSQADPARSVFVDDRPQNLTPAAALGMRTVLFKDAAQLRRDLAALGVVTGRRA
jgi:putative hydrolase of the HAD superfamily